MKASRDKVGWIPVTISLLIGVGAFAVVVGLRAFGLLQPAELRLYDQLLRCQPRDRSAADKVVVVGITEADFHNAEQGVHYPVPDDELADLLEKIFACEPRAVGVDVFTDLPMPSRVKDREHDDGRARLERIWTTHKNAIFGGLLGNQEALSIAPPAGLPPAQATMYDFPADADGAVRRFFLSVQGPGGTTFPGFAFKLASHYLRREQPPIVLKPVDGAPPARPAFSLGRATLPQFKRTDGAYVNGDDGGVQVAFDWRTPPPEAFAHVSGTAVRWGSFDPSVFRDKVVLIGLTSDGKKDYIRTPLDVGPALPGASDAAARGRSFRFGVDVHAAVVDQLLRAALHGSRAIRFWPDGVEWAWVLGWALVGAALGFAVRAPVALVAGVLVGGGALIATAYASFMAGWWIPLLPPLATYAAAAFLVTSYMSHREKADRVMMMQMFSRHVSRDVAESLWRQRGQFFADGRVEALPLVATVLFTDLKGFSGISERMSAQELMAWLNELMDALSRVVDRHGGIVNKYIGDAVMAVFGVPVPRTTRDAQARDAENAVNCALEMRRTLAELNARWGTRGLAPVYMRIGVFTGPLVAGSLGSAERQEYTVIGDTVNTAARLESFDKNLMDDDITADGSRILIGGSTLDLLDGAFRTRSIGTMPIPGKQDKVAIHGVIAAGDPGATVSTT